MLRDIDVGSLVVNYTPLEMWQTKETIFSEFTELEELGGLRKELSYLKGNILHLISDKDSLFPYDYLLRLNDLCLTRQGEKGDQQHHASVSLKVSRLVHNGFDEKEAYDYPTDFRKIDCEGRKRLEVITTHISTEVKKTLYVISKEIESNSGSHRDLCYHPNSGYHDEVMFLDRMGLLRTYRSGHRICVTEHSNENFKELVSICEHRDQFGNDNLGRKELEALRFFIDAGLKRMKQPSWGFMAPTSFGQRELNILISKNYLIMNSDDDTYSLSEKGKAYEWMESLPPSPSFLYSIRTDIAEDFSGDDRISELLEGNDMQNAILYLSTRIDSWISSEFKIRYREGNEVDRASWKSLIRTYKGFGDILAREIYRDLKQPLPKEKAKPRKGKPKMSEKSLTPKKAYETNKAIEKLIDGKGMDPSKYSSDARLFISKYTGYGGLHTFLNSDESHSGILYEYYTPDPIIKKMWGLALRYGFDGGQVLEPSAGIGSFLGLAPDDKELGQRISFTAIEPQEYSFRILNILYPDIRTKKRVFEQEFIASNQSMKGNVKEEYDLVIGNPPYGSISGTGGGRYFSMGENSYSKAKSYDEYFILRGLDVLKSGGLLIYIIGSEVAAGGIPMLQKKQTRTKEMISERADLIDAYRLPNGVFDRTDVLSDIVVFKKK